LGGTRSKLELVVDLPASPQGTWLDIVQAADGRCLCVGKVPQEKKPPVFVPFEKKPDQFEMDGTRVIRANKQPDDHGVPVAATGTPLARVHDFGLKAAQAPAVRTAPPPPAAATNGAGRAKHRRYAAGEHPLDKKALAFMRKKPVTADEIAKHLGLEGKEKHRYTYRIVRTLVPYKLVGSRARGNETVYFARA
jgi:hypothetical protein